MEKVLVTGGTVFVSKAVAEFLSKKYEVYVLNRNNHPQPKNTKLIECNRFSLGNKLKEYNFDYVVDITSYNKNDVKSITDSISTVKKYIFLSSSAVYPETVPQPFKETSATGPNAFWKSYGTNKIEAEGYLKSTGINYFIIRPPYLYGPGNNVYREAFVFDCAEKNRIFYIPKDGKMKLQFFYIEDLCKLIEKMLQSEPKHKIYNVGNERAVSIYDWVKNCYEVAGKEFNKEFVYKEIEQRNYFSFYDYEYELDVKWQKEFLLNTEELKSGLKKSYDWYKHNKEKVNKKDYMQYIDNVLAAE